MIAWPTGVNKYVLRETTWELPSGYIEDTTKSGKKKRRFASTQTPTSYKCVLHMTKKEYDIFKSWYNGNCRRGAISFALPAIDGGENAPEVEYQFTGKSIQISNVGGDVIKVSFTLQEVL